jgi:Secretion system C-terminal sorting domain
VTIVGAGSTIITASQSGNTNYKEATAVAQTLVVEKIGQTITFLSPGDKTLDDANFDLSATASSSLPVSLSTASDKVSMANTTVSLLRAGRAVIKGDQPGDTNHNAAPTVEQSFCIDPPKPVITATDLGTETPLLTSSKDSGNQWYLDGIAMAEGTQTTLTATLSGTYSVQTKVDDCESEISNVQVLVITGDLQNITDTQLELYPNPVRGDLTFELKTDKQTEISFQIIDALGRIVNSGTGQSNRKQTLEIDTPRIGAYFIRVQTDNGIYSKAFLRY